MCLKKVINKGIITFTAVALILSSLVCASARASYQLDSYGGNAHAMGNRLMRFEFHVVGTDIMDEIGATQVAVQEKYYGAWITVATYDQESNPEIYTTDDYILVSHINYYDGIPGTEYRARVTAYASDYRGSDSRVFYTGSDICQ